MFMKKSTFTKMQAQYDQTLSEMSTKLAAHKKSIADLEHDLKILQVKYTISQQQEQALQKQYAVLKDEHDRYRRESGEWQQVCIKQSSQLAAYDILSRDLLVFLGDVPLTSKVRGGAELIQRRTALVAKVEIAMGQEEGSEQS